VSSRLAFKFSGKDGVAAAQADAPNVLHSDVWLSFHKFSFIMAFSEKYCRMISSQHRNLHFFCKICDGARVGPINAQSGKNAHAPRGSPPTKSR
jgi:hypothetical protein